MPKRAEKLRQFNPQWIKKSWAKGTFCNILKIYFRSQEFINFCFLGWLLDATKDENSLHNAYCKVCKSYIRAHKSDLLRHTESTMHKYNMKNLIPDIKQQKLTDKGHVTITSDEEKKTELLLAVYITLHSSIRSIDHLTDVYNNISRNNVIKFHRTKCSLLIKKVIAPAILEDMLHDIKDCPYSLIVDESTDVATIKYLCICVRYFSKKKNKILICFLGLVEVEKVTADNLYLKLKEFLINCGLKISNMIGLGIDGASNLCGQHNSLYTRLKEDNRKLQLIRCICHSLNNASSKASEVLPSNLDFLCREIYTWFSHSSLRRIEYKRLYDILNNGEKPFHNFVQ